jgi:hypothetical protein
MVSLTSSVSSGNSFPMTLLAVKRFVYLASKYFSRIAPLSSIKKKPGCAIPLVKPFASELRTLKLRMTWELGSASIGNPILCRLAKSMRIGALS